MSSRFQNDVRQLAYDQTEGDGPGVVFLGGFASDKDGTKALELEILGKEVRPGLSAVSTIPGTGCRLAIFWTVA